ncbi:MAG TPA: M20/M25/M40 family metallo-hydrolase [Candidatus Limnocylindria bacterium]|nr:M20/M25/M40 family metallo-hydrolase [Candidatus Limnocylindria bacterium]
MGHLRSRRLVPLLLLALAGCASGTAQPTPVSFEADPSAIRNRLAGLQEIADANDGVRTVGTVGYEASVDRLAADLVELGYAVDTPQVDFTGFSDEGSRVEVGNRTFWSPDEVKALIYAAAGDVTGPVAILDGSGCDPGDFAGVPEGAIVVTTGSGCYRRQQAMNAADAGAVAFVVGYPDRGAAEIYRPTLIDPGGITLPVVSATGDAVQALRRAGGETARVVTDTRRDPSTFRNVVATLGSGSSVLVIGAHLDSVLDGPGINDNGSGVAAVLEVARGLQQHGVPDGWRVVIGLWGAEEFGDIGSRAYADAAGDGVEAYLNLDMAGSLNGATLVYDDADAAPGSERLTELYGTWLTAQGEPYQPVDLSGSSDHASFTALGIPTGGLFSGASETGPASRPGASASGPVPDPCYHLACDDLDNVDIERVVLFADATYAVALQLMTGE